MLGIQVMIYNDELQFIPSVVVSEVVACRSLLELGSAAPLRDTVGVVGWWVVVIVVQLRSQASKTRPQSGFEACMVPCK